MTSHNEILQHVYGAETPAQSRAAYDQWSGSYDADNLAKGFRLPALGAGMLARHLGICEGAVLDACCGTGLVGETLAVLGYGTISGCDLSSEMLTASGATGAYGDLVQANLVETLPFDDDTFAGFTCIGSFGPGHAPPESLYELARVTKPGGVGVFNLLTESWEAQGFPKVIEDLQDNGAWEEIEISRPFRPYLLAEPELWSRLHVMRMR